MSSRWARTGPARSTLVENEVGKPAVSVKAHKKPLLGGRTRIPRSARVHRSRRRPGGLRWPRSPPNRSTWALPGRRSSSSWRRIQKIPHVQMSTQVDDRLHRDGAHVQPVKPFDDRQACARRCAHAIDTRTRCSRLAHRGLGQPGEHHHVSPRSIPSTRPLGPAANRDVARAKEAARGGRVPGRHRRRDRLPAVSPPGSCSPSRPWSSSGRKPASGSRST